MRGRPIFWQLFPSYVLITAVALLAVAFYGRQALDVFNRRHTDATLEAVARLVGYTVTPERMQQPSGELDALVKRIRQETSIRITIVDPSGKVVADSEENPLLMDNHATRPEIAMVLDTRQVGRAARFSTTLHAEQRYVAIPVLQDKSLLAAVRASQPAMLIQQAAQAMEHRILAAGLVAVALITGLSWWVARRISRPLEAMSIGAARFASGDLAHRLRVQGSVEINTLAEAMNEMASQLDERIEAVTRQRDEQDAILDSMVEAVLALDIQGRIIDLNPACSRMFHLDLAAVRGRPIHEVLRKADLLAFVDDTLRDSLPVSREIVIRGTQDRRLTARGSVLQDARRQRIGVLVVLNDVTRLHQLENVRRDFVANASHELRTPITSIKGFVETLLDGALQERENAERFLRIILDQANRLDALINDILSLAKIENEAEQHTVELSPGKVDEVLRAALRTYTPLAERKRMRLMLADCPELTATLNARLLEQAVGNLIDNAIKYSPAGSTVHLGAERQDSGVVISVRDEGPGIEPKHLTRLFERFYRVDKARSDQMGGTGLGLAIVKHIAAAHGGSVSVESQLGQGSTFQIHLP
jgi:two-component system phosphate regulon sensor histidine kinase PhoR